MESKELRIGNWVCSDKGLPSETNFVITASDILDVDEQAVVIEPIKLTEEWLVKLGFEYKKTDKSDNYSLFGFRFTFVKEGRFKDKSYLNYVNSITFEDCSNYKNIHQLQNLVFALTGNELILTD